MAFDLETFLPYRLFQAAEPASREFYPKYRDAYGLARTEWRVFVNIGQYGPMSSSEIAQRSGLEKPKISRAVLKLEDRGWIERVRLGPGPTGQAGGVYRILCIDSFGFRVRGPYMKWRPVEGGI